LSLPATPATAVLLAALGEEVFGDLRLVLVFVGLVIAGRGPRRR
jgi:hypothetical protein